MRKVASIVGKDLAQIFRNRFVAVISLLLILLYAVVYNLMPSQVDEVFRLGFNLQAAEDGGGGMPDREEIEERLRAAGDSGEGLELSWADTPEGLMEMVESGEVSAGFSLDLSAPQPAVVLYVASDAPDEVVEAGEVIADGIAYALIGYGLPADFRATMVGADMAGRQIPMRDRLRVMLLAFVFLLELYGLGNLLMEEIRRKTAEALLVTPVTLADFVSAKAVTGIIMAFSQGLLLALLLRTLSASTWPAIIVFLLVGAAMSVGLAFIVGALSKDFISLAMISIIPVVVLVLPGFALLYPGFSSPVIKALPTYYLVEPLNGILNYGAGLSHHLTSLLYLSLFAVGFLGLGFVILRRRLA